MRIDYLCTYLHLWRPLKWIQCILDDMNYVYTFGPRSSENSVNQSGGPAGFVWSFPIMWMSQPVASSQGCQVDLLFPLWILYCTFLVLRYSLEVPVVTMRWSLKCPNSYNTGSDCSEPYASSLRGAAEPASADVPLFSFLWLPNQHSPWSHSVLEYMVLISSPWFHQPFKSCIMFCSRAVLGWLCLPAIGEA